MPRSKRVPGLYKTCKHLWENCPCPWYARYRRYQGISLARWCGVSRFASKDQVLKGLDEFKHQISAGTFDRGGRTKQLAERQGSAVTFSAFLGDYRKKHVEAKAHRSTSTKAVLAIFESAFDDRRLNRLSEDPSIFEDWLNHERESRQWAPTTFNRYHEAGRAMFNWARRHRYVQENPFEAIDRLDTRGRQRRIEFTSDQEEASSQL